MDTIAWIFIGLHLAFLGFGLSMYLYFKFRKRKVPQRTVDEAEAAGWFLDW